MGDIRIFSMSNGNAFELKGHAAALEKSLQIYIERNLEPLLGIMFLGSEYSTGKTHGGRIDTLGIDENGFLVIKNDEDLEKAKPLILQSYEGN